MPWFRLTGTVTNADDGGAGSLRIAMGAANLSPGADTIEFDPAFFDIPRTITLTGSLPPINEELTINGPGADLLTLSGDNRDRVFEVARGVPAILSGLTITDGLVTGAGGGIRSEGPLALMNVAVVGNHAINGSGGVGLFFADGIRAGAASPDSLASRRREPAEPAEFQGSFSESG